MKGISYCKSVSTFILFKKRVMILAFLFMVNTPAPALERDPFALNQEIYSGKEALQSKFISIHYANAKTLAEFINDKHNDLLSKEGYVTADIRTNQLWVHDYPQKMSLIQEIIHHFDTPIAQLLIKVRIMSIDENQLHSLGIIFSDGHLGTISQDRLKMDRSRAIPWQIDIPIIKLGNGHLLDLTLSALAQNGSVRVISSPILMTNDRQKATIESGDSIPYQEKTGEGNNHHFLQKSHFTARSDADPTAQSKNSFTIDRHPR
jgi:type IV pilus assembly protein PilQ